MAGLETVATLASVGGTAVSSIGTIASGQSSTDQYGALAEQNTLAARQRVLQASLARRQGLIQSKMIGLNTIANRAAVNAEARAFQMSQNRNAELLERRGREELALGQLDMFEARRAKEDIQSSFQANAAASGFTATDPTALKLASEIEERGRLQESLALYGGKSRKQGLDVAATGARYAGRAARQAARTESKIARVLGRVQQTAARNAGTANALGYQSEIPALLAAARSAYGAGSAARVGSYYSAAGTILGGGSSLAERYAKRYPEYA